MRVLIGVVILVVALVLIGWISFSVSDNEATVRINSEQVEEDTDQMVESARNLTERADEAIDIDVDLKEPPADEAEETVEGTQ